MEKEKKVLIETYKGIDIFFNKEDSSLFGENKKTNEFFKGKYLFEIRNQIDTPIWEECFEEGFIIGGIMRDEIYKIVAKKRDIKSKKCLWIKQKSTGRGYDIGKENDFFDRDKRIYPYTSENIKVFNSVEKIEENKLLIERDLYNEINKLTN